MLAVESAGWFLDHAWLIPLIPGVAFAVIILFGKFEINGRRVLPLAGSEIGLGSMVVALILAIGTAYQWIHYVRGVADPEPITKSWTWWQVGGVPFGLGEHIDGLAVTMLLLVTLISTLVQIYSLEYVRGDRRFTHFFASLTLFSGGMLTMVLAENMVQLILGWEIMGLCSFLLIGHWWEEEANSRAALKAFLTVRVGDVGLLVGTAIMFGAAHTFTITGLFDWANDPATSHTVLLWASVALFIAAIGKSGQFPLHTWLPDAMAGPTPVSSLLHSSTMVVAGVFLVARLYPVFHTGLMINVVGQHFNLIAVIGGITIIIAAGLAFVQTDIKKVLAYSTVSQLGYMVMALGVGAWTGAVFHFFTHAFFKGLLFLGAGSASHAVHSFDMEDMGGLKKWMPKTYWTFIIGSLALAGLFPFAGFWSKDEILLGAQKNGYQFFMIVGLVGAFMTAAYMTRCVYKTFHGEFRGHGHPHESPNAITVPLITLSVFAVGAGLLNAPGVFGGEWFGRLIENDVFVTAKVPTWDFSVPAALLSTVVVLAGLGTGYLLWFQNRQPRGVTQ